MGRRTPAVTPCILATSAYAACTGANEPVEEDDVATQLGSALKDFDQVRVAALSLSPSCRICRSLYAASSVYTWTIRCIAQCSGKFSCSPAGGQLFCLWTVLPTSEDPGLGCGAKSGCEVCWECSDTDI